VRTLFAKILLWFLGAMVLTITAIVLTTALTVNSEQRQPPYGALVRLQTREARFAYETGGKHALAAALQRFRAVSAGEHILTDASGRDLVTGRDYSKLIDETRKPNPFFPFVRPRVIARPSPDENYWFLILLNRRESAFWFLQPWHLWIVGLIALLSYALAYHFARPVRRLQQAVDRFGRGDFSARVDTRRQDELGQLARTFNQMADRTERLVMAQRRLLQDISHELRSPLARLNVAIELARSGSDRDAMLDRLQKEADRLNALVSELIEVTRAEGDPSHRRTEPVRLDELLAEVVDDSRIEADALGSRIEEQNAPAVTVDGNPELLRRAVENVVRNAIRHTPPGTAVEVGLALEGGRARITVRDQGPGVPEQALPQLFEPFYRVESDRNRMSGGVGLGLAIVRRAVQVHGGTVTAANANPGLLVTIELPAAAKTPAPMAHGSTPEIVKS
jgi:signal transduction histidine kinase